MSDALKEGGRGSERHGVRLRGRLLVAEIALSLVLLAGAGLLIKSFLLLTSVPAGFRAENVLTLRLSLSGQQYNDDAKVSSFFSTLSERVRELPGVQAAGTVNAIPLTGSGATSWLTIEGRPHQGTPPEVMFRSADHGYFQALGIPLRSGRFFTSSDGPDAPKIVLVNEALARRFFPGEDPIGRRIRLGPNPNAAWRTIVGVTGDTRQLGPDRVPQPEAFESQMQDPMSTVTVAIRTAGDPMSLVGSVRAIVNSLDPNQPLFEVQTMEQVKSRSLAPQRLYMMLVGLFATLALILAAAGVYGLMAYSVEQRTLEIGLRMALGAQRSNVLRLMLGQSTRLVLVGIALGSVAALLVTRRLTTLLYEVRPNDPWTYVTAAAILATAALAASYVPTLRAIRIDPAVALRNE
jgi:putative ABC transport system permease protein